MEELLKARVSHLSLQCLCSRAIVGEGLVYVRVLPPRVVEYVSWHQGDVPGKSRHLECVEGGGKEEEGEGVLREFGAKLGMKKPSPVLVNGGGHWKEVVGEAGAENGFMLPHPPNLRQSSDRSHD